MAAVNWTRYRGSHVEGTRSARGVTAVLFTTRHDEMGYPRLPLLLASLCNHMKIAQELIVVTPDDEVADLIRALHTPTGWMWKRGHCSPTWPVRVVPDSYVIPTPRETLEALLPLRERPERGGRGAGYRLQMLLKLGVSSIVETPHYLTLDSDMFVTRVVSLTDLLTPEGKARVQLDLSNHRESWWTAAEAILAPDQKEGGGSSTPNVHGEHDGQYDGQHDGQPDGDHSRRQLRDCMRPAKGRLGIGVTPAVLDAAVVRALLVRLEAQWGEASVASCPYPLVSTTGTTSSSSSSNRVPAWRPIPGTECAVGDGVTAIWAGNRQRVPASIAAVGTGFVEVDWADKDPSFRRVLPELVHKKKKKKTKRKRANAANAASAAADHEHQNYPCSRRPLCRPASQVLGATLVRRWDEVLMDVSGVLDWSEYTLYWGMACVEGWSVTRHAPAQVARPLYDDLGGGYAEAHRAFRPGDGPIVGVLQSIAAGADQRWFEETIAPLILSSRTE